MPHNPVSTEQGQGQFLDPRNVRQNCTNENFDEGD